MDYKTRILDTIKGKKVDRIPFVPRLDLWYSSNKRNNTLPEKYRESSLLEIVQDLGVGFHSVVPTGFDFLPTCPTGKQSRVTIPTSDMSTLQSYEDCLAGAGHCMPQMSLTALLGS